MKRVLAIILTVIMLASCYKSDLTNTTHPEEGMVIVDIIIPTLSDDESASGGYTIIVDGEEVDVDEEETTILPTQLEPGEYTIYVHNNPDSITIENEAVEYGNGTIIATADSNINGEIESLPEHLYFGSQTIEVLADAVISTEVELSQITRDIYFNLQIAEGDPDRITSIEASLSGIAGAWECVSDMPWGDAVTIRPEFTQGASLTRSSSDNDHIIGLIRIFGINGSEQILTIVLTFSDGKTQTIVSDISDQLTNANSDKPTPIILSGDINTPIEAGIEGTITNWNQINGGSQTVN